jgi:hypothetical protein
MFTHKDLLEVIDYDKNTGIFTWSKKRRGVITGKPLGTCNGYGYLRITVFGKSYYAHRLAWFYVHGYFPKNQIDHINGVKSDNKILNLREATSLQNAQNKLKPQKNSKSHILGVSWHKKAKKWQAHICIYKQRKYLGLFENIHDAENAFKTEKEKVNYVGL